MRCIVLVLSLAACTPSEPVVEEQTVVKFIEETNTIHDTEFVNTGYDGCDELSEYFPDADGDGFGNEDEPTYTSVCDKRPDGFVRPLPRNDCDDADPTSYPSATEKCDEADNDCDGLIDNEPVCESDIIVYFDAQGRGEVSAGTVHVYMGSWMMLSSVNGLYMDVSERRLRFFVNPDAGARSGFYDPGSQDGIYASDHVENCLLEFDDGTFAAGSEDPDIDGILDFQDTFRVLSSPTLVHAFCDLRGSAPHGVGFLLDEDTNQVMWRNIVAVDSRGYEPGIDLRALNYEQFTAKYEVVVAN